ncbi:hypothetical protein FWD20_03965 [Candidatus Saccharibacteria bacterium]|nr:hypothetical protein [Candidatus Saccharibacteria bacterium]
MDLRYSYILLFILPKLLPLLIIFILRKDLRRVIWAKGLIGGALGLAADFLLTKYYWQPYTLFGRGIVSIESFIYGFCAVALVAVIYLFITERKDKIIKLYQDKKFILKTISFYIVMIIIGGGVIYSIMRILNLDVWLSTTLVIVLLVALTIIRLRKWQLIKTYLGHALIVVLIMLAIGSISYFIWWLIYPNFWPDVLILDVNWNITILGFMPLSELIYWTIILGAVELELGDQPGRKIVKKKPI